MGEFIELVRRVRDCGVVVGTALRRTTDVCGVTLSLQGVSPRMRYVMLRGYEGQEAKLVASVLSPDDAVLEAGSAVGFLALYCLKYVGVHQYCMVEANDGLVPFIRRNFELNGVGQPVVISAAVSETDGVVSFGVSANFWSSSIVERPEQKRVIVAARTIPSIVAELPFTPNTLIMDIEGTEAKIPMSHFASFRKVVIETHRKLVGDAAIDHLLSGLTCLGFREHARIGSSHALVR